MRDRLVAAVLAGAKTCTCSLHALYVGQDEALPVVGQRSLLLGSGDERIAVVETTNVSLVRMADVDDRTAQAEGEGFRDARDWRDAHEAFWSEQLAGIPGGDAITLDDDTIIVVEYFRLVHP